MAVAEENSNKKAVQVNRLHRFLYMIYSPKLLRKLAEIELRVETVPVQKRFMTSLLNDMTIPHDQNDVRFLNC